MNRTPLPLLSAAVDADAWRLAILFPSLLALARSSGIHRPLSGDVDGAFAISPILNYLLASLGFLCLFGWAAVDGMFRDIEQPKLYDARARSRLIRRSLASADPLEYPRRRELLAFLPRPASGDLASDHHRFKDRYDHD